MNSEVPEEATRLPHFLVGSRSWVPAFAGMTPLSPTDANQIEYGP